MSGACGSDASKLIAAIASLNWCELRVERMMFDHVVNAHVRDAAHLLRVHVDVRTAAQYGCCCDYADASEARDLAAKLQLWQIKSIY